MSGQTLFFPEWKTVSRSSRFRRSPAPQPAASHALRAVPRLASQTPRQVDSPAPSPQIGQAAPARLSLVPKRENVPSRRPTSTNSARRPAPGEAYAIGLQTRRVVAQIESEITRQAYRRSGAGESAGGKTAKGEVVYLPARFAADCLRQAGWRKRTKQALRRLFGAPLGAAR